MTRTKGKHVLEFWAETKELFLLASFCKRLRVLLVSVWPGSGVGFRWVVGGDSPVANAGKGEGGWGGQCTCFCQNYPLANYP